MLYVSNIIDESTIEVSDSRTLETMIVNADKLRTEGTKVFGLTRSRVVVYRNVEDFLARYALRQKLVNHDYEYTFKYIDKEVRVLGVYIYTGNAVDLEIPDFVDTIEDEAFQDRSDIRSVCIPDSVVKLGEWCFPNCVGLEFVRLSQSLKYLSDCIFWGCTALTSIVIPEGVTQLGRNCFARCALLTDISLPDGITELDANCFYGCTSLESITLPEGVTRLGGSCFAECTALINIVLPKSITVLDGYCFCGCTALTNIVLPEGLTELGERCFYECTSLKSVVLPEGVVNNCISDLKTFLRVFKEEVPSIEIFEIAKSVGISLDTIAEELDVEIRLLEE